jgi:hypothetical protein
MPGGCSMTGGAGPRRAQTDGAARERTAPRANGRRRARTFQLEAIARDG